MLERDSEAIPFFVVCGESVVSIGRMMGESAISSTVGQGEWMKLPYDAGYSELSGRAPANAD